MSQGRRASLIAAIALTATCAAAPGAGAAVTVGSDLARAPDAAVCTHTLLAAEPCTEAVGALTGTDDADAATVPMDGVVVRWRIRRGVEPPFTDSTPAVSLRVIRGTTGAGRSAAATLASGAATTTFATRLPVLAGDLVGVDVSGLPLGSGVTMVRASGAPAGDVLDEWRPPLADGATSPPAPTTGSELLLNADVEPDADGDGFGDETQDACPTNPAIQVACEAGAPETAFTKKPRKKSRKTRATAKFTSATAGATFECSLDSVAFRACASPLKLKHLRRGTHVLLVRAVAGGIADPSPASARFKVKKKKRRRRHR